ncbi:LysE family transporter [Vreelandella venusta]|uniref:LysE family transporter n=2 Tax=Vreelandella venusta TaxID=44935 RepID=UPI0030EB1765
MPALWRQLFMVGLSNPKAILFFSSPLPQFISSQQNSHIAILLPLILLFIFIKLIVSSAYALAAQTMASPQPVRVLGVQEIRWLLEHT